MNQKLGSDRVSVPKDDHTVYKDLTSGSPSVFPTMKDVFLVATSLGFQSGSRESLSSVKTEQIFDLAVFDPQRDLPVLRAIALTAEGDVTVLQDDRLVLRVAEEYAHAGIRRLRPLTSEKASQALVSIATLLLKDVDTTDPIDVTGENALPLADLIPKGESEKLEFKSSLRWDTKEKRTNKDLQKEVAKAVSGFMNHKGGVLLIGVTDQGEILGIEDDLKTLGKKKADHDGFQLTLMQELQDRLGTEFLPFVHVLLEDSEKGVVCRVEVEATPKPVFLKDGRAKTFYLRSGNSTKPLDVEEAHAYIRMRFG